MTETDSDITRSYGDYNEKLSERKGDITKSYRSHNEKLYSRMSWAIGLD